MIVRRYLCIVAVPANVNLSRFNNHQAFYFSLPLTHQKWRLESGYDGIRKGQIFDRFTSFL
jgi:hypothetical protein